MMFRNSSTFVAVAVTSSHDTRGLVNWCGYWEFLTIHGVWKFHGTHKAHMDMELRNSE